MPGGLMPYIEEKGAYFSVVESLLSTYSKRKELLLKLRAKAPNGTFVNVLADLAGLDSINLNGDGFGDGPSRIAIVNRDWFGYNDPPGKPTTGFWEGWDGEPETIFREALTRAIEVGWGIANGAGPPAANAPMLPIDIYWICQGPFFQCWIDWRKWGATGHVVLVITTPPPFEHPINWRITRDLPEADWEEYAADPPPVYPAGRAAPRVLNPTAAQGMWVVGHPNYEKRTVTVTSRSDKGQAVTTKTVYFTPKNGDRSVCVVSPAEREGGVRAGGRAY